MKRNAATVSLKREDSESVNDDTAMSAILFSSGQGLCLYSHPMHSFDLENARCISLEREVDRGGSMA